MLGLAARSPLVPAVARRPRACQAYAAAFKAASSRPARQQQRHSVSAMAAPSLAQLDAKLEALPADGAYLLFKADWCPDCVRSTQAVRDAVAAAGAQLLEVDVGAPTAWRMPTHPLRTDARFQLTGVPTLVFWSSGVAAGKLGRELERAATPAAAAQVAAAFVKQTAEA